MDWLKKNWPYFLFFLGTTLLLLLNYSLPQFFKVIPVIIILIGIFGIISHYYKKNLRPTGNAHRNETIPEYESEKLFELSVFVKALIMTLAFGSAILAFFGYQSYQNLKQEIIQIVDPQQKLKTLDENVKKSDSLLATRGHEIDSLNEVNRWIIKNINEYKNKILPIGSIVAFDGKKAIPEGWTICDGKTININNGRIVKFTNDSTFTTPNLINRFIVGTTLAGNVELGLGEMGGSKTHFHKYQLEINSETLENIPLSGKRPDNLVFISTTFERGLGYIANHTHRLMIKNESNDTENSNSLPPYYALIFIIKYK